MNNETMYDQEFWDQLAHDRAILKMEFDYDEQQKREEADHQTRLMERLNSETYRAKIRADLETQKTERLDAIFRNVNIVGKGIPSNSIAGQLAYHQAVVALERGGTL